MARIEVWDFDVDPDVAEHIWGHGLTFDRLYALISGFFIVRRNRAHRTAPYLLIGEDNQGQCWAVPIVPTEDPVVWRPITAWRCKNHEADRLYRK